MKFYRSSDVEAERSSLRRFSILGIPISAGPIVLSNNLFPRLMTADSDL